MKKILILLIVSVLNISCSVIAGGSCEPYSEWKPTEITCESNFGCIFKGQKALYQNYIKQKQCKNGIVQKKKKKKIKCGC